MHIESQAVIRDDLPRNGLVGAKANNLLGLPGFSGRVLAVVSNTAYLLGSGYNLLWIAVGSSPAHARGILLPSPLRSIVRGMPFEVRGPVIDIGSEVEVNLAAITVWSPPRLWPPSVITPPEVRQRLCAMFDSLVPGSHDPIYVIKALFKSSGPDPMFQLFSRESSHVVEQVARDCIRGNLGSALENAGELLGMGPGLTPAGDDFVGGLLFAAQVLSEAYPNRYRLDAESIAAFLAKAKMKTNLISETFLRDLSEGDGPAPLHDVLCDLVGKSPAGALELHVRQLSGIGHSTGNGFLAGACTGLLLTFAETQAQ
jgi:hypothetical protein